MCGEFGCRSNCCIWTHGNIFVTGSSNYSIYYHGSFCIWSVKISAIFISRCSKISDYISSKCTFVVGNVLKIGAVEKRIEVRIGVGVVGGV